MTKLSGNSKDQGGQDDRSPAPAPDIRRSLFFSFNIQTVSILLRVLQQVILIPIMIRGWGAGVTQDWIVISSAAGLCAMFDLGAQIHFSNTMVIAWSLGDRPAFYRTFALALTMYAAIIAAALLLLLAITLTTDWSDLLHTRTMPSTAVSSTLIVMVLGTLTLMPIGVIGSIYRAHGDYFHGTIWIVMAEAARGFGVCAVAFFGWSPLFAALLHLVVALLLWLFMLADLRRRFGRFGLAMARPDIAELVAAMTRSALYFIPSAATPIVVNIPVLLLGRLAAPGNAVLAYTVLRTLTGFVRQFVAQMCHPIGSEMARQQVLEDRKKLHRLFIAGGRLASGLSGLMGGGTLIMAQPFLLVWVHGAIGNDPWLFLAFLGTIMLLAPAQVAMVLFLYNNRPSILIVGNGGYALGTVLLCSLLVRGYSAVGAAVGTGLSEFIFIGLYVSWIACRDIAVRPLGYLGRSYLVGITAFAVSGGVAWALQTLLAAHTLVGLVEVGVLWLLAMILPAYFLLVGNDERVWLRRMARHQTQRLLAAWL